MPLLAGAELTELWHLAAVRPLACVIVPHYVFCKDSVVFGAVDPFENVSIVDNRAVKPAAFLSSSEASSCRFKTPQKSISVAK